MILDKEKVSELLADNKGEDKMEYESKSNNTYLLPSTGGNRGEEGTLWGLILGSLLNRGILDRGTGVIDNSALNSQLASMSTSLGMSNDAILAAINANGMQTCAAANSVKDSVQNLSMTELSAIGGVKDAVQTNGSWTRGAINDLGNQTTRDTFAIMSGMNNNHNNTQTSFARVEAGQCDIKGVVRDTSYATDANVNRNFADQNLGLLNQFSSARELASSNYNLLYNQAVVNNTTVMAKLCEIECGQTAGFVATNAHIDRSNDAQTIRAQEALIHKLEHDNSKEETSRIHNELNVNSKNIGSIVDSFNNLTNEFRDVRRDVIAIGNNISLGGNAGNKG